MAHREWREWSAGCTSEGGTTVAASYTMRWRVRCQDALPIALGVLAQEHTPVPALDSPSVQRRRRVAPPAWRVRKLGRKVCTRSRARSSAPPFVVALQLCASFATARLREVAAAGSLFASAAATSPAPRPPSIAPSSRPTRWSCLSTLPSMSSSSAYSHVDGDTAGWATGVSVQDHILNEPDAGERAGGDNDSEGEGSQEERGVRGSLRGHRRGLALMSPPRSRRSLHPPLSFACCCCCRTRTRQCECTRSTHRASTSAIETQVSTMRALASAEASRRIRRLRRRSESPIRSLLCSCLRATPPSFALCCCRVASFFHLLFKVLALAMYLFCSLFFDSFILGQHTPRETTRVNARHRSKGNAICSNSLSLPFIMFSLFARCFSVRCVCASARIRFLDGEERDWSFVGRFALVERSARGRQQRVDLRKQA